MNARALRRYAPLLVVVAVQALFVTVLPSTAADRASTSTTDGFSSPFADQSAGQATGAGAAPGSGNGASGAAGVVATALAMSSGLLPPTINIAHQDPDCDLDVIPNTARPQAVEAALCNCLGFGSKNSALVLGRV